MAVGDQDKNKSMLNGKARSKGVEILVSVPNGVASNKNVMLLDFIDTCLSRSLASSREVSYRYKRQKGTKATAWSIHGG